jgi:hypothetical protein
MRNIFIVILLFSNFSILLSQDYSFSKDENGEDYISEVVECTTSKEQLFSNAQEWIAKTFGDYKSVIQFENKDDGKLIIKGFGDVTHVRSYLSSTLSEKIKFTMTIEFKDNRYRYTISDIVIVQTFKMPYVGTTTSEENHHSHLVNIEEYNVKVNNYEEELSRLKGTQLDELKKKERKKILEEMEKIEDSIDSNKLYISSEITFYQEEYEVMTSIVQSLKVAMLKDDNNW